MTILLQVLTEGIAEAAASPMAGRLCALWARLADAGLPNADALTQACRRQCPDDISLAERAVEDFVFLEDGSNVVTASGFDLAGVTLTQISGPVGTLFLEQFERALGEACPVYFVHRAVHAKTARHWERLVLPARTDSGALRLVLYSKPDVGEWPEPSSDLMRTEQALRESERRFLDFAETSSDWFWEMDVDLRFTYMSDSVAEHTGRPASWHIGKSRRMISDPEVDEDAWRAHLSDLAGRRPFRNFRYFRRREDGSKQWFSTSGRPLFDDSGAFAGYRGVASDITAQVETEQEALLRKQELEELNRQKDKLFSIIGHDLKSPFTTVIGFAEVLSENADGLEPEQVREYADMARQSAQHAYRILDDLLQWARLCVGRHGTELCELDLKEVVAENLNGIAPQAAAKEIALCDDLDVGLSVLADRAMLNSVLRNLLSNAVKFTPDGGRVTVRSRCEGGVIETAVCDTGVGIPPERLEHLFDLTSTYSTAGTRRETGTGFGLHICRELVQLHGGELRVSSTPGEGTTFRFTLPVAETLETSAAIAAQAGAGD